MHTCRSFTAADWQFWLLQSLLVLVFSYGIVIPVDPCISANIEIVLSVIASGNLPYHELLLALALLDFNCSFLLL